MMFENGLFSDDMVRGTDLGNDCHVLNENNTIMLSTGKEFKLVEFDAPTGSDELIVTFQSQEEFKNRKEYLDVSSYYQTQTLTLQRGVWDIHISEQHTSSLPAPYTSDCIKGSDVPNMFSSIHTIHSCRETCAYDNMLHECRDTIDIWKKYNAGFNQPFVNSKYTSQVECIKKLVQKIMFETISNCTCRNACKEIVYKVNKYKVKNEYLDKGHWSLIIRNVDPVTRVDFVPDYPLEEFLGAFGGVLGLGAKCMTLLQLLLFLSFCLVQLFTK